MQRVGFSLVELSIVLVILGLLTGGILAGQSLIRASELRAVSTEASRLVTATQSFRDKYFAIPGDMKTATKFWTALSVTSDADCQAIAATGAATCNGNGDGNVTQYVVPYDENTRIWQHLANAGLIEGSYTGTYDTGYLAGTNAPRTKLAGSGCWFANSMGQFVGNTIQFAGNWGSYFGNYCNGHHMSAEEAWNIDTKMDDGRPSQGRVYGFKGDATDTCTNRANLAAATADADATYSLTNPGKHCSVYFLNSF